MSQVLASSLLKLKRAKSQLDALNLEISGFLERKPYVSVFEIDDKERQLTSKIRVREKPSEMWSVLIGEFLHNVRSSLDFMIWDLVILETNAAPAKVDKIQFPIFQFKSGYDGRAKQYLKGVGSSARRVIEKVQPFSTGEDTRSPLWHLHQLSNWDKHRTLHLTGSLLQHAKIISPRLTAGVVSGTIQTRPPGPFEDGDILFKLRLSGTSWVQSGETDREGELTCNVTFDQSGPLPGAVVIDTLGKTLSRVTAIGTELSKLRPA